MGTHQGAARSLAPVYVACAASLVIGCVFIFVRAPHPWGWEGFDHYHDLGRLLARGEPFPTTDVPWGYAYFLAAFYRPFGDHPWIPLLAQVALNALVPLMLYRIVSLEFDRRTAIVAAVLAGGFSFNTLYASTQSSDAVCTVLFVAALLLFAEGRARGGYAWFAGSGALFGLAPQFRPNLVMLPAVLAGLYLLTAPRRRVKIAQMVVYLAAAAVMLAPWTARNYRLLGLLLPTSTHGGVQLWYGTLQAAPYLESRLENPRSAFEFSGFDYSSVAGRPLVVTAELSSCARGAPESIALVYWTDRQQAPLRVPPSRVQDKTFSWTVPGQPMPTVVYYFVEARWPPSERTPAGVVERLPYGGADQPAVHFVSDAHLNDLDTHGDLLDVFDVIRMDRSFAWDEPLPHADRLGVGERRVSERDLRLAINRLLRSQPGLLREGDVVTAVRHDADRSVIAFADSSTLTVPRAFSGSLSDVIPAGEYASRLVKAVLPLPAAGAQPPAPPPIAECRRLGNLGVNRAFYLAEPDSMRRYTALAWDNIRHTPGAYLASCLYRVWRLFVVQGTGNRNTTYQFRNSRLIYTAATLLSATYFLLFVCGVALAIRQRRPLLVMGAPILYVPVTIAWVLTNMRYTVTVQPLVFAFVALTVLAVADRAAARATPRAPDAADPT